MIIALHGGESVEMRIFALYIMALALTIYLALTLVITSVFIALHVLNLSYLQIYLHELMLYVRLYGLETVSLHCLAQTI